MRREVRSRILVVCFAGMALSNGAHSARAQTVLNNRASGSTACEVDSWAPTDTVMAPGARSLHTAVWTGAEMIVWGGAYNDGSHLFLLDTGSRYDPATDTWTDISMEDAPIAREAHTAVWTGSEMIVWGGADGSGRLITGGRYDPTTDTWVATSTVDAPSAPIGHTAVWTGKEMIVWNGITGGRYDPATDTWAGISPVGAPSARSSFTAVWTGKEMIIWGGGNSEGLLNTGARYDPAADTWIATSTVNVPSAREVHSAVWADSGMIVWGGYQIDFTYNPTDTGGYYNPTTDTWSRTNTAGAPSARGHHKAVWTGTAMVVWGGGELDTLDTGGRYNPVTGAWAATTQVNAPDSRAWHTAISTDTEMIVWGGFNRYYDPTRGYVWSYLGTGGRYCTSDGS